MNNSDSAVETCCPSSELLSAWHDGEEDTTAIAEHLHKCPECRNMIETYRRVDAVLTAGMQAPPGLTERILAACQQLQEPQRIDWTSYFFRAAALLAVVLAMTGLFLLLQSGAANSSNPTVASPTAPPTGATTTAAGLTGPALLINAYNSSLDSALDKLVARTLMGTDSTPTILPKSVRHVWVVHDVYECRRLLPELLPPNVTFLCARAQDGAIRVRISLTDRQLQELVNRLETRGWALVTPDLPQPGRHDRLALTDRELVYVADLVMR